MALVRADRGFYIPNAGGVIQYMMPSYNLSLQVRPSRPLFLYDRNLLRILGRETGPNVEASLHLAQCPLYRE